MDLETTAEAPKSTKAQYFFVKFSLQNRLFIVSMIILEDLIHLKDKNLIKVITGIRRCGKSTIFELFQSYLFSIGVGSDQIININLEDGEFRSLRTSSALYEYVQNRLLDGVKNYVFLDEIQIIEKFYECVDWLYVKKNVDLYLTGSNAFILSGELATLLSGRYVNTILLILVCVITYLALNLRTWDTF